MLVQLYYCCFSYDVTRYLYHLECSLEIHYPNTIYVINLQTIFHNRSNLQSQSCIYNGPDLSIWIENVHMKQDNT